MEINAAGKVVAHLLSGKRVMGDAMLYAMGRLGNTDSLNLQARTSAYRLGLVVWIMLDLWGL